MTTINRVQTIYKARKTILSLCENRGFDTSDYNEFGIDDVNTMYYNDQLNLILDNEYENSKMCIHFYLDKKQIKPQNLDDIVEQVFYIDELLSLKDTLIIISDEEPNDTIVSKMKYLYDHSGIFVVIHNIKRLQYNILEHELVPKIEILDETQKTEFMKDYNVRSLKQLPEISRFDPQALAIAMRPGDICKITRDSPTVLKTHYYRVCI